MPTIDLITASEEEKMHYLSYSQYFNVFPKEAKNLLIHANNSISLIFPKFIPAIVLLICINLYFYRLLLWERTLLIMYRKSYAKILVVNL